MGHANAKSIMPFGIWGVDSGQRNPALPCLDPVMGRGAMQPGSTITASTCCFVVICSSLALKSTAVSSLLDYPAVADAFRKSNTTLPSSAAVERLFTAASQVLTACRCRLADETMDKLMLLRSLFKAGNDFIGRKTVAVYLTTGQ